LSTGEHFTKADWRPGKRRKRIKRVKPWGGRKTAPAAFLEAAKATWFKKGYEGSRVCSAIKRNGEPCGRLALRGLKVCGAHGGWSQCARLGVLVKTGKKQAIQAQRAAAIEGRSDAPPAALARLPVYQGADQRMRMKLILAYGTTAWTPLLMKLTNSGKVGTDVSV
jgi:hypothetical protein